MIYHFGKSAFYEAIGDTPLVELYDLEADPEELDNLAKKEPQLAQEMIDEILAKFEQKGIAPDHLSG